MSKRLLIANAALGALCVVLIIYVARVVTTPPPSPAPTRPRPAIPPPGPTAPQPPAGSYGLIASRNLFSPSRSEAPVAATGPGATPQLPKPNLYGVVLRDGAPIAYLEDPVTKRVAGYRVGDSVAGGTLQSISADKVVLVRPEGPVDVRLHDPAKPRPAAPAPGGPGAPTTPSTPGGAVTPPRIPPFIPPSSQAPAPPPVFNPAPQQPGAAPPTMPPNLRRRIPPGVRPDAVNQ